MVVSQTMRTVRCTVQRNFGTHTVTLELEDLCEPGLEVSTYLAMFTKVDEAFKAYIDQIIPVAAEQPEQMQRSSGIEIPTRINVKMENGKRLFRLICPSAPKWGAPLYEEALMEAKINPKSIPDEGIDLTPGAWKAIIERDAKGGPKRVAKLWRPA